MHPERRRRVDRVLIVLGAAVVALVAMGGAFAGDTERVAAYWAHAHVDVAGAGDVVEVIDYDFGSNRKHGLLRQIPDLAPTTEIAISSPTAPDQFTTYPWWLGTEIRVGDPAATISNRHRYQLEYHHNSLRDPSLGSAAHVSWNAVGDGWTVPVNDVEIHITSDQELIDPTCHSGTLGSTGGCTVVTVAPGHIMVTHDKVEPGEFLTVTAGLGQSVASPLALPTAPAAPTGPAPDPGTGWKMPLILAGIGAIIGGAVMSPLIRRLGREMVWEGGAADAAFGPADEDRPTRRADLSELQELSTIEFEPPRELSAAVGGVVHLERVHNDHKTAWLLEAAIREEIILDPSEQAPTIQRGPATPNPAVAGVLNKMFGASSNTISLKKYNPAFAAGWQSLGTALDDWRQSSGLWDERGEKRRVKALAFGWLSLIVGAVVVGGSAGAANRTGNAWLVPLVIGAVVAGAAFAAIVRAWELRVRSAAGSGSWIRIESFRRFLHESEAEHVERAADMGLLRQYTAWAVALGEVDRWEKAARAAAATDARVDTNVLHFAITSHVIASAVRTASTAPSSSGGGGGGGGAGGGGGGGGGGSW